MKDITIHKDNELIKYELTKYLKPESFNILDYLYHKTQKHINQEKKDKIVLYKEYAISIPQAELKKWLQIKSKNYVNIIRESLKELSQPIDLFNYKDTDGKFVNWGTKSFIESPRQYKQENGRTVFELTLKPFLFNVIINIKNRKGWTEIHSSYQINWRSTNTKRLYQYLKSIQNMNHNPNHSMDDLNKFFIVKKPLKTFGRMRALIGRNLKIINRDTDIEVNLEEDKEIRTFYFNIKTKKGVKTLEQKKKESYKINKDKEDNEAIDRVIEKKKFKGLMEEKKEKELIEQELDLEINIDDMFNK